MKSELLDRRIRLSFRKALFPYVTKFMDRRIDSYLSLFYECETYTIEELKRDLCEVLYNPHCYSVCLPTVVPEIPIYQQLTLF